MAAPVRAVDYWCNAFFPDRQARWEETLAAQGIQVKIRTRSDDSFATPDEMVARMDELGIETLVVPTGLPHHSEIGVFLDVAPATPEEMERLHAAHPGRFVGQWSIVPGAAWRGVADAAAALEQPWCVGLHYHTHSWDRRFDHQDLYPYYTLCAQHDVPFVMQAGTSGGLMPSECGLPIGIDRPALYFPTVRFVLSHTGWPWVTDTIAMALKFPNVYLGTAVYPARYWSAELVDFINRAGRTKCLWGTGFPAAGHRHTLEQLPEAGLSDDALAGFLGDTARRVFTRLAPRPG